MNSKFHKASRKGPIPISLVAVFSLLITLWSGALFAGPPPPGGWAPSNGISMGISGAYVNGGRINNGFCPALDFTFFQKIHRPIFWWGSLGTRFWLSQKGNGIIPYVETGLSIMILNIGVGYGPGAGSSWVPKHSIHMFTGINIPVYVPKKGRLFYVEPYYRPTFPINEDQFPTAHEVGVMVKWLFSIRPKYEQSAP